MSKDKTDADVAFIEALAELLDRNALTELSVRRDFGEDDSLEVHLSRATTTAPVAAPPVQPATAAHAPAERSKAQEDEAADPARHPGALTSPMVGTVYLAAEPGADPFVGVGSEVSEGQTVLIIEAMKTMNHIPSPRTGTVKRILVGDATPVEFGAPLMIIE